MLTFRHSSIFSAKGKTRQSNNALESVFILASMALCLITILVRQAPISLVAPRVFVAESAIFWNVSKKEPNAKIVFLKICCSVEGWHIILMD